MILSMEFPLVATTETSLSKMNVRAVRNMLEIMSVWVSAAGTACRLWAIVCKTSSMNVQPRVDLICLHMGVALTGGARLQRKILDLGTLGAQIAGKPFDKMGPGPAQAAQTRMFRLNLAPPVQPP